MREGHDQTHKRNLKSQMVAYNASGSARTADYLMPLPGVRRPLLRGKGRWKSWTPGAVVKAAFQGIHGAARTVQFGIGGSAAHAVRCRSVVAEVITREQRAGLEKLLRCSRGGRPCSFFVTTTMFDETKLPLVMDDSAFAREVSVLASHTEVTWEDSGKARHEDVIRAPQVLRAASASCMWSALRDATDPCCLAAKGPAQVRAAWRATLLSCDSGSANVLLIKQLTAATQDEPCHLILPCYCQQRQQPTF